MQAGSFSSGAFAFELNRSRCRCCADERREIFITTKVPGGGAGVDNYKSTLFDAKVNLQLLKVDYVDRARSISLGLALLCPSDRCRRRSTTGALVAAGRLRVRDDPRAVARDGGHLRHEAGPRHRRIQLLP